MMENPIFKRLIGAAATFTRWVGDASRTLSLIFICGVVLTILQALLWSYAIRKFAVTLVNVTITLAIVLPAGLALYLYYKSGLLDGSFNSYAQDASSSDASSAEGSTVKDAQLGEAATDQQQAFLACALLISLLDFMLICYVLRCV
jgi:hypothetical protein